MTIQIIDLFFTSVFKKYSGKYNIYRELFELDLLGIEIRNISEKLSKRIKKIVLANQEICYTVESGAKSYDLLILGTFVRFKELTKEITASGDEEIGNRITQTILNYTTYDAKEFFISSKNFSIYNSYIFGILNVTPDSFSDGGKHFSKDAAINHALQLIENGADVIDIGGESTRPGADRISEEEEIFRVIPVIGELKKRNNKVIISVDTTRAKVAELAIQSGAIIVNDISSGEFDSNMLDIVKEYNVTYVVMHMQGIPKTMQINPHYSDVVSDIYTFLDTKVRAFKKSGIKNVIIDPGIGFGKKVHENYEIIKRLNEFKGIGCPIMIGLSRKSFLGKSLNLGVDKRDDPTLVAETLAIKNGAKFIRTHNVNKAFIAKELVNYFNNPELLEHD